MNEQERRDRLHPTYDTLKRRVEALHDELERVRGVLDGAQMRLTRYDMRNAGRRRDTVQDLLDAGFGSW